MNNNKKKKILYIASSIIFLLIVCFCFKENIYKTLAATDQEVLNPKLDLDFSSSASEVDYPGNVIFNTKIKGIKAGQSFNYTFWYDCSDDSSDYSYLTRSDVCGDPVKNPSLGIRYSNIKSIGNIPKRNYPTAGKYTAKVLVERGDEKVERRADINVKPKVSLIANSLSNDIVDVNYGGSVDLSWTVAGLSDSGKCASSWDGEKQKTGSQKISSIEAGTTKLILTCTEPDGASGFALVEAKLVPKIDLRASSNETSISSSDLRTAEMPFNAQVVISWNSYGTSAAMSTPCTGFGSDSSWDGKMFGANGSFIANKITTNTKYGLICSGLGGKNEQSITLKIDQGNCSFEGNNTIKAAVFCKKKLVILNEGDNVNFTGSFVAKKFSLSDNSKNIRFYYDPKTGSNWPPGFRYLDIPDLVEKPNN